MRTVQLIEPGQALEAREVPTPAPGPGEVLVRIAAAGICRSDVHYRSGFPTTDRLPITLGHEIAGMVEEVGSDVRHWEPGDRVVIHYQLSCGKCDVCAGGHEQFCGDGAMLGKAIDGGYAEFIAVPHQNLFALPAAIDFEAAAVMMCSSATPLHALRKGRFQAGETVAVFGAGGLGMSAIQIARALGAARVIAIDVNPTKLELAARLGAIPVAGGDGAVAAVREATDGRGVDIALELAGLPATLTAALESLAIRGRAVAVGLIENPTPVAPYDQFILKEAELIGSSDHLASEIPELLALAAEGALDTGGLVTARVGLDSEAVNAVMDGLETNHDEVRTVIISPP